MYGRPMLLGVLIPLVGIGGCVLGIVVDYPGRPVSVRLAMVGVTMPVVGDARSDRG